MSKGWRWMLFVLAFMSIGMPLAAQDHATNLVENQNPRYAHDWMFLLYRRIQAEDVNPPAAARIYGLASVALYEALLGGMPDNNSLAGQIPHLPDLPLWEEDTEYDWISVLDGTLAVVLPALFFDPSDETRAAFAELRATHTTDRLTFADAATVERSLAYGATLGEALLAWINADGAQIAHEAGLTYTLPVGNAVYALTSANTRPMEPYWGEVRPLILEAGYDCAVSIDVPLNTDPNSTFYKQAEEVVEVERNLTEWQKETARYWLDNPGGTGTPAGHWMMIAGQFAQQMQLDLIQTAMTYSMTGIAVHDAFIAAWWVKYQTLVPRPITFIREHIRRRWLPYIETPPFPEYPSGHSVVSAAAAGALNNLFGAQAFVDETHVIFGHEPLVRSYTSFEAAAAEAAISRLYGGIHYRNAIENGMQQGRCIAAVVNREVRLSAVLQGE